MGIPLDVMCPSDFGRSAPSTGLPQFVCNELNCAPNIPMQSWSSKVKNISLAQYFTTKRRTCGKFATLKWSQRFY